MYVVAAKLSSCYTWERQGVGRSKARRGPYILFCLVWTPTPPLSAELGIGLGDRVSSYRPSPVIRWSAAVRIMLKCTAKMMLSSQMVSLLNYRYLWLFQFWLQVPGFHSDQYSILGIRCQFGIFITLLMLYSSLYIVHDGTVLYVTWQKMNTVFFSSICF